mgnify:CR=1 FL=1|jgi:hypothetical protein
MTKKEKQVLDQIVNEKMLCYRKANNGDDEHLKSLTGTLFFFAVDVREALENVNNEDGA